MSRPAPSILSIVGLYTALTVLVPAGVVLSVSASALVDGIQSGSCPPTAAAPEGSPCGPLELVGHILFGPETATLTIAMTVAWAIALAMALAIYFGMKHLFASQESERLQ